MGCEAFLASFEDKSEKKPSNNHWLHLLLTRMQQLNTSALCKVKFSALIQSKPVETRLGLLAWGCSGMHSSLKKKQWACFSDSCHSHLSQYSQNVTVQSPRGSCDRSSGLITTARVQVQHRRWAWSFQWVGSALNWTSIHFYWKLTDLWVTKQKQEGLNVSIFVSGTFTACRPLNCDRVGREDGESFFLLIIKIAHWLDNTSLYQCATCCSLFFGPGKLLLL